MKLFDVLCSTRYEVVQGGNIEIKNLHIDSRRSGRGSVFFCIKGLHSDGHAFAADVIAQHAAAIVVEDDIAAPEGVTVVRVPDTREALAYAAANYYGRPADKLTMIGVTGTNGKTSTTYLMESVLAAHAKRTGIIGTVEFRVGTKKLSIHTATSTTPDTIELHQILTRMQEEAVDYAVMEVTSHALALRKTDGIGYKVGIFTNLTQDHLDFHGTMEEYRGTKARFFGMCENSVINADDPHAGHMISASAGAVYTYGITSDCDYKAEGVRLLADGCAFTVNISGRAEEFFVPVRGRFTVYNCLGVVAAADCLGVPVEAIREGLKGFGGVPGRIQSVKNDRGFDVVVDYAHTPDGLGNIISAVREVTSGRVLTVFGCGGDRDRAKRPVMGRIAGELSDYCVITSDNPRTENPEAILNEIEPGVIPTGCGYEKIADRQRAIDRAVELARAGDSVIIAGKGHENYQIFSDRTIHFDDREAAESALRKSEPVTMTLAEAAEATGGECADGGVIIRGVSTDTRTLAPGNLYIALAGENHDGHDYVPQAFAKGAAACMVERAAAGITVRVGSTAKALLELAEHHRRKHDVPVVAVTGSAGKTTTKDMIASVLSQRYNLLRSEGNFNNEIGLPLTLLRLTAAHECAVLEMGMNHAGEISRLSKAARPNICVITNIGMAHIENLGSREAILRAKAEIFDYMSADGTVILNGEDELLRGLTRVPGTRMSCGFGMGDTVYADCLQPNGLNGMDARLHYDGIEFMISVPLPGEHMVLNALAAAAVGLRLGLSAEQVRRGLAAMRPSKNRMEIFDSPWGFKVINDCYNANPASMRAVLDILARHGGNRACILGDMRELGAFSEAEHASLGRCTADLGIDTVIFTGPECRAAYEETLRHRRDGVYYFADKAQLKPQTLRGLLADCAVVLVKGSRAMRLEQLTDGFREVTDGI